MTKEDQAHEDVSPAPGKAGSEVVFEDRSRPETKIEVDTKDVAGELVVIGRKEGVEIEGKGKVAKPKGECQILGVSGREIGLRKLTGPLCDLTNEICVVGIDDFKGHREFFSFLCSVTGFTSEACPVSVEMGIAVHVDMPAAIPATFDVRVAVSGPLEWPGAVENESALNAGSGIVVDRGLWSAIHYGNSSLSECE